MKYITVYCGASTGIKKEYVEAAMEMGKTLSNSNIGLVYGGASTGLMGAIADSVLAHGGNAIGVMPKSIADYEVAHNKLTKLYLVNSMHERKELMASLGDAFITMPGGFGTIEELFEIITWMQLGFHSKPIGILNTDNYYTSLLDWLGHCVANGFIGDVFFRNIGISSSPNRLIQIMRELKTPDNLFIQRQTGDVAEWKIN